MRPTEIKHIIYSCQANSALAWNDDMDGIAAARYSCVKKSACAVKNLSAMGGTRMNFLVSGYEYGMGSRLT